MLTRYIGDSWKKRTRSADHRVTGGMRNSQRLSEELLTHATTTALSLPRKIAARSALGRDRRRESRKNAIWTIATRPILACRLRAGNWDRTMKLTAMGKVYPNPSREVVSAAVEVLTVDETLTL